MNHRSMYHNYPRGSIVLFILWILRLSSMLYSVEGVRFNRERMIQLD